MRKQDSEITQGSAGDRARLPRLKLRLSSIGFVFPLLALWAVPVVAFVILLPASRALESSSLASPGPTVVTVGSRLDKSSQGVDTVISRSPPASVRSAVSGLVTSVQIKVGDQIGNGTPLFSVNGASVIAFTEPMPLYRDLTSGSKGQDVRDVTLFLADLGFIPNTYDSKGTFGRVLTDAVSAFERKNGIVPDGIFHASSVAWIPTDVRKVSAIKIATGDSVAVGAEVIQGPSNAVGLRFLMTSSDSDIPKFPDGPISMTVGSSHIEFGSLEPTETERQSLFDFLTTAESQGSATAEQTDNSVTFHGAVLSIANPKTVGTVPSSALFSSKNGTACLFIRTAVGTRPEKLSNPALITGELGSITVPAKLIGSRVIKNPGSLTRSVTDKCG